MRASRPTIIEVRGSRLGLDIRGSQLRSRPSSAQMSEASSRQDRAARSRLQQTSDATRQGRTTLLSRPRSAERAASRPGPASVRSGRPCTALPRSVKAGPNSRRPRRTPPPGPGVETAVKQLAPSTASRSGDGSSSGGGGGGGDAARGPGRPAADQTSCLCSTSSLSRWTGSVEPGTARRKGVTFSDTLSTDTGPAGAGAGAGSDSSDTSPSEAARRRVAARPLPAAAATDELTRELLARGQQLRQGMARLIARQGERSGSLTPPDSEVEARLAKMGVAWDSQRPSSAAARPSVSAAAAPVRAAAGLPRPRTAFTLPSESSTSGPLPASYSTGSAVPPLELPPSLLSGGTGAGRRRPARSAAAPPPTHSAGRQMKTANMPDRLPLLRKASFLRVSVDSLSLDPVFVRSVSSAPDAADTRVYLEYELPLESGTSARRSTRLGGKRIATETALNHRSVIPLRLTAAGVRLWQASELQLTALGQAAGRSWTLAVAALPLRQLLRQPRLALSRRLALTLRAAGRPVVGHVRLRLELGSDRDDFPAALAAGERGKRRPKTRPGTRDAIESEGDGEDGRGDGEDCRGDGEDGRDDGEDVDEDLSEEDEEREEAESRPVSQEADRRSGSEPCLTGAGDRAPPPLPPPTSERSAAADSSSKVRLLHWAVRVGRGTPSQPGALRNTYLVVRAPWLQRAATSVTCWAEEEPQYDYTLISPVLLTAPLVARLHNNLLVVEVWQRSQAAGQDRLVGLSRLPLERLYITFSQPDVTDTVLQMKSPVLVHEGRVAVNHPASDSTPAQLELTLAAGTQEQVDAWMAPERDRRRHQNQSASPPRTSDCTMVLKLDRLLHVPDINEAKSGEVDCFVQYTWPVQTESGELSLRSFTTEPAISRVNPPLAHSATYRYRAPAGGHLAEALVAACAPDAGVRWDVVVRTFYPVVRDKVIARGVLSSSQIFGLVEACRDDGRQSRRFAVPLELLDGGQDPAHPSLEVSLTVDTAPSAPGSQTELSGSSSTDSTVRPVRPANQLPTWSDVIAGRTKPARVAVGRTNGMPRLAETAEISERFETDPSSEAEIRQVAREQLISRRHTRVCGEARGERGWADRPGRSPVPITREEGSQTELESQAAISQAAESQEDVSQAAESQEDESRAAESQAAESRAADSRAADSRAADSRADGADSDTSDGSLDRPDGEDRSEETDSQPSSESEMRRRLRRPLGAPAAEPAPAPAVERAPAERAPADRAPAERADILSDIERDLDRLRRTGSIFAGQRRAAGEEEGSRQAEDGACEAAPAAAMAERETPPAERVDGEMGPVERVERETGRVERETERVERETGRVEREAERVERGGAGDAARRRSWAAVPAAAADCRPDYRDVPLVEPAALSGGRQQQVLHVRTEADAGRQAERCRLVSSSSAAAVGRRGDGSAPSSEAATPATRAASSLESAPASHGRSLPPSSHAPAAPTRGAPQSNPTYPPSNNRAASLLGTASRAESWVSAVTPGTRPASSLAGPPSPASIPEPSDGVRPPASVGDGDGDGAFRAQLTVVEALHLPKIVRGERREQPRVFVSVQTAAGVVASPLETGTRPRWNWSQTVWVGRELLQQEFHYLVLKVWHRSGSSGRDRVLGLVLIDLVPLLHGLDELLGWYNIVDLAGVCRGQMKLSLRPLDDVPCVERESLDLSVSLDDPDRASYVTTSCHASFPSHLTRYPELTIRAVNKAHHRRDSPLELSPREDKEAESAGDQDNSSVRGRRIDGASEALSEHLLQLLPSADECELMDGTRSFLTSVLRKNLEDLDSLKAGLLRRVEPDWTSLLSVQTNHAVKSVSTSADRSACSSRSGQARSRSPHTAGGTAQGHGRKTFGPDAEKISRSRVDSRTYISLTNGVSGSHREPGSAAAPIGDHGNHNFAGSPPRGQRSGDPAESLIYVRAMNDVSSGNYASGVFCHRREVRGGPTAGSDVTSAPVGRLFSEQEAADLRRRGSGASGGGGELPGSVVELIETAVRRSAEVPEPPPASSDSDSLPFGDNLRSLNDTSESERGGPAAVTSHSELFISILQEMEARDGGAAAGRDGRDALQPADEAAAALGAILARDMSRLTANVARPASSGAPSSGSYATAPEPPDSDRGEAALAALDREAGRRTGADGTADQPPPPPPPPPPAAVQGGSSDRPPPLLSWREEPASDGRRSARRCRLAAALDMR